ncbi:MAG TPA: tRNA uridine-5-carboxymethylaminomethyl(34) synthesis GTPase MnmE [Verrucomicrobiae bacterium]|nr:tRNA uridine-5-carboxymethylaminomethyl(34) synthesis GTPase MnmE [Verrucomicrobiae bacterium]
MEDTIAAISTPIGEGGIAIIRVSGPRAFDLADKLFHPSRGRPSEFPSHTIHFGTAGTNGEVVDQVMLTVMRAPRTYTKEDTVEINCHGGILTARKLLSLCLQNGVRLAEPGEFTKRAFLNGRIDLTQAEAVMDLIRARTDRAHTLAVHELEGHLSAKVNDLRERLITMLAHIEAHIDFPEEDIAPNTRDSLLRDMQTALALLQSLLATAREGKILREGITTAIVGRPNVGKSSLFNALLGQDRSIVTPVPGTTRDTVEELANIHGVPFRLIDTAGIRHARGRIETIGVRRTRNALEHSEFVLHILDTSRPFSHADHEIATHCTNKRAILVLNKADLPRRLRLPTEFTDYEAIPLSATTGEGLPDLRQKLAQLAFSGAAGSSETAVAINERHRLSLSSAYNLLTLCANSMTNADPIEVVSQQLRLALDAIGEVTGKTVTDDILERVFSTFCIGK